MKNYILKQINDTLETIKGQWATNYVAMKELEAEMGGNTLKRTPENNKQVEACKLNMKKADEKVALYEALLAEETQNVDNLDYSINQNK